MSACIMVVEDDVDLLLSIAIRLRSAGYLVISANDGPAAIELAIQRRPDAILLDIGLPGMDGHAVARRLAAHDDTCKIPVVFLTARHELEHRVRASEAGSAAYIEKPCRPEHLFTVLESVLTC